MALPATVTGLVLAAGAGRRLGGPKALVDDGSGPWVLRAAQTLLDGGCGDVLVVTGAAAEDVEDVVAVHGDARISTTRCGTWEQGMGESLRAGLTALATRGRTVPTQALVHLVDLPDVGPDVVARVLSSHPTGAAGTGRDALVRAAYQGRAGHPVLLGQDHWQPVLAGARGDAGARAYLRRARPFLLECGDLATGADVDWQPSLIAFDIDGTLMDGRHAPRPSTLASITRARARGIPIALASSRDRYGLRTIAERIGLDLDGLVLIGNNGSQVVADAASGEVTWAVEFPHEVMSEVVRHTATLPVTTSLPAGPRVYTTDPTCRVVRIEARSNGQEIVPVADLSTVTEPVTKVLFTGEPGQLAAVAPQIRAPFEDRLTFAFAAPYYFDATYGPVDKGVALQQYCERAGLDVSRLVVFGDSHNDVGMLRAAGLGVAMGNAVPAVQEAADVVTTDHDTDGIAAVLGERFGL